jgi:hypothetical protein
MVAMSDHGRIVPRVTDAWVQRILPADLRAQSGRRRRRRGSTPDAQRTLAGLDGVQRADFVRYIDVAMPDGGRSRSSRGRSMKLDAGPRADAAPDRQARGATGHAAVWVSEAAFDLHGSTLDRYSTCRSPGARCARACAGSGAIPTNSGQAVPLSCRAIATLAPG